MVFDKTGTLTEGHPALRSIYSLNDQYSKHEILRLTAAVEATTVHPLAKAVKDAVVAAGRLKAVGYEI